MSKKSDAMFDDMKEKVNHIEKKLGDLKKELAEKKLGSRQAVQERLSKAKADLDGMGKKISETERTMAAYIEEFADEKREQIDSWKSARELKSLEKRAEKKADKAASAVLLASAYAMKAECAVLEAIEAELDLVEAEKE